VTETMSAQLGRKSQHVALNVWRWDIEFITEDSTDVFQRSPFIHERPDARADRIQPEVDAALQIEQHALSGQLTHHDLLARSQTIVGRQVRCGQSGASILQAPSGAAAVLLLRRDRKSGRD